MADDVDLLNHPKVYPGMLTQADLGTWQCRIYAGLGREEALQEIVNAYVSTFGWQTLEKVLEQLPSAATGLSATETDARLFKRLSQQTSSRAAALAAMLTLRVAALPAVRAHVAEVDRLFDEYAERCAKEYAEIEAMGRQEEFESNATGRYKMPIDAYYRWVRSAYYRKGITDPVNVIRDLEMKTVRFVGWEVTGGIDKEFLRVLKQAEQILAERGRVESRDLVTEAHNAIRKRPHSFSPRPLPSGSAISQHGLGRAVDIDPAYNEHIMGKTAAALDALLDWLEANGTGPSWRFSHGLTDPVESIKTEDQVQIVYDRLKSMSDSIQAFLKEWAAPVSRKRELTQLLKKIGSDPKAYETTYPPARQQELWEEYHTLDALSGEYPLEFHYMSAILDVVNETTSKGQLRLQRWIDHGFVTLVVELYQALKSAGELLGHKMILGIEYDGTKDIHHVDIPGPAAAIPRCVQRENANRKRGMAK